MCWLIHFEKMFDFLVYMRHRLFNWDDKNMILRLNDHEFEFNFFQYIKKKTNRVFIIKMWWNLVYIFSNSTFGHENWHFTGPFQQKSIRLHKSPYHSNKVSSTWKYKIILQLPIYIHLILHSIIKTDKPSLKRPCQQQKTWRFYLVLHQSF